MRQYRDPELFGIWQALNVKTSCIHYYKDGYFCYTEPQFNTKGEIISFNDKKTKFYYYTKADTLYQYSHTTLHGDGEGWHQYKIKNDTLFRFSKPDRVRIC